MTSSTAYLTKSSVRMHSPLKEFTEASDEVLDAKIFGYEDTICTSCGLWPHLRTQCSPWLCDIGWFDSGCLFTSIQLLVFVIPIHL